MPNSGLRDVEVQLLRVLDRLKGPKDLDSQAETIVDL